MLYSCLLMLFESMGVCLLFGTLVPVPCPRRVWSGVGGLFRVPDECVISLFVLRAAP